MQGPPLYTLLMYNTLGGICQPYIDFQYMYQQISEQLTEIAIMDWRKCTDCHRPMEQTMKLPGTAIYTRHLKAH